MREITGRHVLFFTVAAFGVIIAVNVVMAYKAISTFPGLEVGNSYVASQSFDARRAAQENLGWTMTHDYDAATSKLILRLTDRTGAPVSPTQMAVLVGRTTEAKDDQQPVPVQVGSEWHADLRLAPGKWLLKVVATAQDGTLFEQRVDFFVKG